MMIIKMNIDGEFRGLVNRYREWCDVDLKEGDVVHYKGWYRIIKMIYFSEIVMSWGIIHCVYLKLYCSDIERTVWADVDDCEYPNHNF